jgi:PPOX class probable F420-dependent enzyme
VPITFALVEDEIVTAVDRKPKRSRRLQRLANIAANPWVSVLADAYAEDWSRLWWVRIDGPARVLESGVAYDRALGALLRRYPQYRSAGCRSSWTSAEANRRRTWRNSTTRRPMGRAATRTSESSPTRT